MSMYSTRITEQIRLEDSCMRLLVVCPPEGVEAALAEAKRRESLMPPADAMASVRDDITAGRWRPRS